MLVNKSVNLNPFFFKKKKMPLEIVSILSYFGFILLIIGAGVYFVAREGKEARKWEFVAEGAYDHAEYGMEYYTRRAGRMKTSIHEAKMTVVYMSDGSCYTGRGFCDMPFPRGTYIKIFRNGLGRLRVQKT